MFVDALSAAGLLLTALSLVFVGWQLRIQTQQRRIDLGMFYIQRFWAIDDDRVEARDDAQRSAVHDRRYLRLTEDEFDAHRLRSIDQRMWKVWHATFASEVGRRELLQALDGADADHGDYRFVRACLDGPMDHAVSACPAHTEV